MKRVIHWFRRDLRLHDNTALLRAALAAAEEVIPVYILSRWQGHHRWTGAPRQQFLCGSLDVLGRNLEKTGGGLIIRQGSADEELAKLLAETRAEAIFFNRDPDPFGRQMEEKVAGDGCVRSALSVRFVQGHRHPRAGRSSDRQRASRFAFSRRIRAPGANSQKPVRASRAPQRIRRRLIFARFLSRLSRLGDSSRWRDIIEPGEDAARKRLDAFHAGADRPLRRIARHSRAPMATSRLSQDLRYGLLSPREVYARAAAGARKGPVQEGEEHRTYINELIWRGVLYARFSGIGRRCSIAISILNTAHVRWYEPGADFDAWRRWRDRISQSSMPRCASSTRRVSCIIGCG